MDVQRGLGAQQNGGVFNCYIHYKNNQNKTIGQVQSIVYCMLWIIMKF